MHRSHYRPRESIQSQTPRGPGLKHYDDADVALVARMRASRAGWSAIARALGAREPDVRRRFDPSFLTGGIS